MSEYEFALCLTHDVDRPFKRLYQALYHARRGDIRYQLESVLGTGQPYAQFDTIRRIEDDLGVRSALYFLQQPRSLGQTASRWPGPTDVIERLGRYDVDHPRIRDAIEQFRDGGWEIGVHGSLAAPTDPDRLLAEKRTLETLLDEPILGGRQHHLALSIPDTWRYQQAAGLRYDSSIGASDSVGFRGSYRPFRPFDADFVVFPLTVMDVALPDVAEQFETALTVCEQLLSTARERGAVMTVCWHPMYFNSREFPGYTRLYRTLVERALSLDAWVGPPGTLYELWTEGSVPVNEAVNPLETAPTSTVEMP